MAGVSGADLLEWWSEWPKWSGWGRGRGSTWIGERSSCLLHPRHHDCDSQIHNLVSLQRAPLQPYCPPETHLYQEQLRWRSRHPPHHHRQQNAITAIITNNTPEHAFDTTFTYSWPKVNVATNGEGCLHLCWLFKRREVQPKFSNCAASKFTSPPILSQTRISWAEHTLNWC